MSRPHRTRSEQVNDAIRLADAKLAGPTPVVGKLVTQAELAERARLTRELMAADPSMAWHVANVEAQRELGQ